MLFSGRIPPVVAAIPGEQVIYRGVQTMEGLYSAALCRLVSLNPAIPSTTLQDLHQ